MILNVFHVRNLGDLSNKLEKAFIFAGPKRGRHTAGFSIFVCIPKISTDSGPPIKYQLGVFIKGDQIGPNWVKLGKIVSN